MRKLTILAISVILFASCHSKKAALQLNLTPENTYSQISETTGVINQTVNGMEMSIEMNINGDVSYKVNSKKADNYDLDVQYKKLYMKMKMPQGGMEVDSEKIDEKNMLSKMFGKLTSKPFGVTISKKGKLIDAKGLSDLFDTLFEDMPDLTAEQKTQLSAQLEQTYGEKGFSNSLESSLAIFPDKPVKVGDTWVITTTIDNQFKATVTTTYTFVKKTKKALHITGEGTIVSDTEKGMEVNGLTMTFAINGISKTDLQVDPKTGWIIGGKIDQNMKGKSTVKANEQLPQGLEIPMEISTSTIIKNK